MNKYVKEFLHRGLIFGGFGPLILGVILFCIELGGTKISLNGSTILLGVFSTYLLAFVQAGASVFNQIEGWPITKSLFFHFLSIYLVYVSCYLINSWIPFNIIFILIFTLIFIVAYFIIWLTVYLCVKCVSKKMNNKLK